MSVVCLIATWRDGELLAEAVASAEPHVDAVVVLDGGYHDVVAPHELSSSRDELHAAREAGAFVFESGHGWADEVSKRNVLLELGRAVVTNPHDRWALVLDADEVLVVDEPGRLRAMLEEASVVELAPGLRRREPDGAWWSAPSRLFRLRPAVRYFGRSHHLWTGDRMVTLEHGLTTAPAPTEPYVEHRWDRRPVWRRHGRMLALSP